MRRDECDGMLPWQTWPTHLCVFLCLRDTLQHAQLHTGETLQPLVSLLSVFHSDPPPLAWQRRAATAAFDDESSPLIPIPTSDLVCKRRRKKNVEKYVGDCARLLPRGFINECLALSRGSRFSL